MGTLTAEREQDIQYEMHTKIINKWALPFSALPLSSPQHTLQASLFHEDTHQTKLWRCQGHTRGSTHTHGVRWSQRMVLMARGCQALQSCPREQDSCPGSSKLPSDPSGTPGIPEPTVENTKDFKNLQQRVPSYTRNKPVPFFMFFKINATKIVL